MQAVPCPKLWNLNNCLLLANWEVINGVVAYEYPSVCPNPLNCKLDDCVINTTSLSEWIPLYPVTSVPSVAVETEAVVAGKVVDILVTLPTSSEVTVTIPNPAVLTKEAVRPPILFIAVDNALASALPLILPSGAFESAVNVTNEPEGVPAGSSVVALSNIKVWKRPSDVCI